MKILHLSPPTVSGLIKICYFVAMLMQIFHALLTVMGKNRENSLSCGSLTAVSVFLESGMCVWNILSVFEGLGVFSKLLWSQESAVHVWVTCSISPSVLCRGYGVQGWALPSLVRQKFALCCHWPAEFQLCSCWLAAVSWIPPLYRTASVWLCLHWVQSSMFRWKMEVFPQTSFPSLLTALSNLSSANWLYSSAELIAAAEHTVFQVCVCTWIVISQVKVISQVYIQNG